MTTFVAGRGANRFVKSADYLPNCSIITNRAKIADMISISSEGLCGVEDFRGPRLNGARLTVGKAGGHRVEKSRYALDMECLFAR